MADSSKVLQVQVTVGTIVKTLLVLGGFFLAYYLFDLILVILLSIVIASSIEPATRWFARYHVPRVLAVLTIYVLAFFIFAVLVPVFVFPIISDLSSLTATLPAKISTLPLFADAPAMILAFTGRLSISDIVNGITSSLASVPHGISETAGVIFNSLFKFILVVVISFYLAVQPKGIESFLRLVAPLSREKYVLDLWQRSQKKIGMWMQGQLLLGLIMGVLVFLGLSIFQVEHALLLAILAALFEIIPFFGPVLAAVPAVAIAFSTSPTLGFMIVGLYVIMQQFENHLIYPLVVRKIVGVPPLLVILSLIVGAQVAGFIGLILAVPVATVLMEMLADFEKSKYLFEKVEQKANA